MLTDAECKNATCPPDKKRARLACSGGLYLEISPAGSKRWFYKYRKDCKEGRMALGSYPDVALVVRANTDTHPQHRIPPAVGRPVYRRTLNLIGLGRPPLKWGGSPLGRLYTTIGVTAPSMATIAPEI